MGTLTEQRDAAMQAAKDVVDTAKNAGRDLSDDEAARVERHLGEVKQVDGKIESANKSAELVSSIDQMVKASPDNQQNTGGGTETAHTLGEHVVKSVGQQLAQSKGGRFSVSAPEYKAATDPHMTPGYTTPQVDTTVVQQPRTGLTLAGLLGSGTMQASALTYFVEGAAEGSPGAVAEGGAKPQLHYSYSTVTDALSKLAGIIKVSDEMVEDLDFLMTEINNRLLYDLSLIEEQQLLSGDGTAPNLSGLLNREGVQTMTSAAADDNLDSVFRAITAVQTGSNYQADGIVINPADYQTFRLSKDGNGQYYAGGPFTGAYGNQAGVPAQPGLWGRPTVVTPAISQGTVLVGNFAQGGTVYRKGGVRVESTNSHESDFANNMVTIRAEERLALAVRRPSAFVTLTLGAAAA